ncbi:MAG: nucleotide exchange factor GrpE [Angelakisella sp.]|nr:nucleotide exchange factor GrpE [Angelakisella sp.]
MAASDKERKNQELPLEEEPVGEAPIPEEVLPEEETPQEPSQLEQLQEEKKELEDRYLRLMAEFGNFRNRTAKEKESTYGDAKAETLRSFLPVLDNLQRALESPCSDEEYKKGVELIHKGLWEVMTSLGVEEIAEAGVPFDPEVHNAVMHIEDEALPKNTVAQVLQKGYRVGSKILRYAMVQAAN